MGVIAGGRQWKTSSLEIKSQLIHQGLGWGRLPLHLIQESLQQGALKHVPCDLLEPIEIPLYLIRHSTRALGKSACLLWKQIENLYTESLFEI